MWTLNNRVVLVKKKLGRKRNKSNKIGDYKNQNKTSEIWKHTKFSEDNLMKKCKSFVLQYLIIFNNKTIKEVYNNNIGYGIKEKKLLINQEQRKNYTYDYYKAFINTKLKDIFSVNQTSKYKYHLEEHNTKLIQQLLNEEDTKKRDKFSKLFELTFLDCVNILEKVNK